MMRASILLVASAVATFAAIQSLAAPPEYYLEALRAAQAKVDRGAAASRPAPTTGLRASAALATPSTYRVGDHWDVIAWSETSPQARMVPPPEGRAAPEPTGRLGYFRYEVIQATPVVRLRVSPLEVAGVPHPDRRIEALELTLDSSRQVTDKVYHLTGNKIRARVSAQGVHSRISALELFPLDLPELATAEPTAWTALPSLPYGLASLSARFPLTADPARSTWFEQDDFFGRPVQVLWQQGDPWPRYLKTPAGIALLVTDRSRR